MDTSLSFVVFTDPPESLDPPDGCTVRGESFTFDGIYTRPVGDTMAKSIYRFVVEGNDAAVIFTGPHQSGKSRSMWGDDSDGGGGVLPRTLRYIADTARQRGHEVTLTLSAAEVLGERIRDGFAANADYVDKNKLHYGKFDQATSQTIHIKGEDVSEMTSCLQTLRSHAANDSYATFIVTVRATMKQFGMSRVATVTFVDGSTTDPRRGVPEPKMALHGQQTLRRVLESVVEASKKKKGPKVVVPFRDSLLTTILAEPLSSARLYYVVHTSGAELSEETLRLLRTATKVRTASFQSRRESSKEAASLSVSDFRSELTKIQSLVTSDSSEVVSELSTVKEDLTKRVVELEEERRRKSAEEVVVLEELRRQDKSLSDLRAKLSTMKTAEKDTNELQEELARLEELRDAHAKRLQEEEEIKQRLTDELENARRIEESIATLQQKQAEREETARKLNLQERQRSLATIFRTSLSFGRDYREMARYTKRIAHLKAVKEYCLGHLESIKESHTIVQKTLESVRSTEKECDSFLQRWAGGVDEERMASHHAVHATSDVRQRHRALIDERTTFMERLRETLVERGKVSTAAFEAATDRIATRRSEVKSLEASLTTLRERESELNREITDAESQGDAYRLREAQQTAIWQEELSENKRIAEACANIDLRLLRDQLDKEVVDLRQFESRLSSVLESVSEAEAILQSERDRMKETTSYYYQACSDNPSLSKCSPDQRKSITASLAKLARTHSEVYRRLNISDRSPCRQCIDDVPLVQEA